jgi:hypothetical protein
VADGTNLDGNSLIIKTAGIGVSEAEENMKALVIGAVVLISAIVAAGPALADDGTAVVVNAPEAVPGGTSFDVTIDISEVSDLNSIQYDISYDPAVLQLQDIDAGRIGDRNMGVMFNKVGEDSFRIVQSMGLGTVSGSGHLITMRFRANGSSGRSEISLTGGIISGFEGVISATWISGSTTVIPAETGVPETGSSPEETTSLSSPSSPFPDEPSDDMLNTAENPANAEVIDTPANSESGPDNTITVPLEEEVQPAGDIRESDLPVSSGPTVSVIPNDAEPAFTPAVSTTPAVPATTAAAPEFPTSARADTGLSFWTIFYICLGGAVVLGLTIYLWRYVRSFYR